MPATRPQNTPGKPRKGLQTTANARSLPGPCPSPSAGTASTRLVGSPQFTDLSDELRRVPIGPSRKPIEPWRSHHRYKSLCDATPCAVQQCKDCKLLLGSWLCENASVLRRRRMRFSRPEYVASSREAHAMLPTDGWPQRSPKTRRFLHFYPTAILCLHGTTGPRRRRQDDRNGMRF
jgi:hypothetical protein